MDSLKIDIMGLQNAEREVNRNLKTIKGSLIEKVVLDDDGKLIIYYTFHDTPIEKSYTVKQASKRKYETLDEFIDAFVKFQGNLFSNFNKKWVIELKKIWLVFFEN